MLSGHNIDPVAFAETKIIPALNKPYKLIETTVDTVGVSVGIASFPEFQVSADDLVSFADDAMYAAKRKGKNTSAVYYPSMKGSKKV